MTLAVAATAAGCAASGAGVDLGGDIGGRYLVMIPALEGPSGAQVANELRALVTEMATHAAINDAAVRGAMDQYDLSELNEITARQLAQQIRAQLVSWGTVREGGSGLTADITFIDTASGDEIVVNGATGATPVELATSIFADFEESVEGIRQAAFCNDYLSSQQFDRALETCETALAIVPNSSAALYGKATALLNLERYQESLDTYNELLGHDPTHQDALLGAGLAASRLDQGDVAMSFYNRYLEVNPGNVQVRMTVANDIAQTGDYVSAFRVLETAIAENSDNTDFQEYLFSIATAAGQRAQAANDPDATQIYEAALAAYQAAYAGEEVDAAALRQAIAVNNALERTDEALRLAREATQRFPDEGQIWSQYATVLTSAERYAEAAQALTSLIAIDPDYENVYIRRAQAYLRGGQRQQAIADLRTAADRGDRETVAQVLSNEGLQAFQAENFADAASMLSLAYEYASGELRSNTAFYWAFALFRQGAAIAQANQQGRAAEAQRALEFFRRALPLAQGSSNAQAAQVVDALNQYIANQDAIIRASQR